MLTLASHPQADMNMQATYAPLERYLRISWSAYFEILWPRLSWTVCMPGETGTGARCELSTMCWVGPPAQTGCAAVTISEIVPASGRKAEGDCQIITVVSASYTWLWCSTIRLYSVQRFTLILIFKFKLTELLCCTGISTKEVLAPADMFCVSNANTVRPMISIWKGSRCKDRV